MLMSTQFSLSYTFACVYALVKPGLSNDDGEVNENGKKAVGLDWQNNNFARESCFSV